VPLSGLCYVRCVVLCATVGFVLCALCSFVCHCRFCVVHPYLQHFVSVFDTNVLLTPILLGGGVFPCAPRVLTVHVRAILKQCLNDSDISILRTPIVGSTER